jgi:hypothetical protein
MLNTKHLAGAKYQKIMAGPAQNVPNVFMNQANLPVGILVDNLGQPSPLDILHKHFPNRQRHSLW